LDSASRGPMVVSDPRHRDARATIRVMETPNITTARTLRLLLLLWVNSVPKKKWRTLRFISPKGFSHLRPNLSTTHRMAKNAAIAMST